MSTGIAWTQDRIANLQKLNDLGLSAAQIARQMGMGLTRGAVIGKRYRLGMEIPDRPRMRKPTRGKNKKYMNFNISKPADRSEPSIPEGPQPEYPTINTDLPWLCKWPHGESSADWAWCSNSPLNGKVYCEKHDDIANKPTPRMQQGARRGRKVSTITGERVRE